MKKLIVKKTGIGRDVYSWNNVTLELDHGALLIRLNDETLVHAYSAAAWLEIEVVEE
jgi:hypothetical protein